MEAPRIVRYRPPRARVAVAYSTKDRVDLTLVSVVRLIDDPAIDLYWFDGSATEAGRQLPEVICAGRAAICELHQGVVGGPDCAIMYALQTLRARSYDLVILVENDVLLSDGWFEAMRASIDRAEMEGFRVGAATVRIYDRRVLSFNDTYCLMLNSGAGFIALRPAAIDIVLANYRTLDGVEFLRHVQYLTGLDVSAIVEFEPSQRLSVDFIFDIMLYLHGYAVTAPPVSYAGMIDGNRLLKVELVTAPDDHLPQVRRAITRPEQIRNGRDSYSRFQKSPLSGRLLAACQQLRVGVNLAETPQPLRLEGTWRRAWMQGVGPFGLKGAGKITLAMQDATIGLLLYSGALGSELRMIRRDQSCVCVIPLGRDRFIDFPFSLADTPTQDLVLHVVSGEICVVGLTADAAVLPHYVNDHPTFEHLPF